MVVWYDVISRTRLVSMRDLFADFVMGKGQKGKKGPPLRASAQKPLIGLLTMDPRTGQLFERDLPRLLKVQVRRYAASQLIELLDKDGMAELSTLVIDIDSPESERWLQFLRAEGKSRKVPFTFILFDPARHSEKVVQQLEALNSASHLAVFAKPVSLMRLLDQLKPLVGH
jgi:hypothetical protein